ncbi:MAG: hypothetical protein ACF8NJ_08020 [Phycisphaerales bacterium JB038]
MTSAPANATSSGRHWMPVTGARVEVDSDGSQAVRACLRTDSTKLLIADHLNGGSENFLGSHHTPGRWRIEPGQRRQGSVALRLQPELSRK